MYGCDCDGVRREPVDSGADIGLRAHLRAIDTITHHRPPTCPWRSFSEPIVREVLGVSWAAREGGGGLSAALGPDPDAILVEGVGVYKRSLDATLADERRIADEERDRKSKQAAAAARRSSRG